MFKVCLVLVGVLAVSLGFPTEQKALTRSAADLALLLSDIRFPEGFDIKAGIIGDNFRWPNRVLVYEIDGAFNQDERNVIEAGINAIQSTTCIQFRQRSSENDWVFIQRGGSNSGCWSYVGKQGGRQILNLQVADFPGAGHCIWSGTVSHELIHAIGYFHEQSRTDRDDFVTINWGNIPSDVAYNFDKFSPGEVDAHGVEYDYSSIMHYDAYAFAIDRNVPTIIPHNSGATLGNDRLTDKDMAKINRMYQC